MLEHQSILDFKPAALSDERPPALARNLSRIPFRATLGSDGKSGLVWLNLEA